MHRVLIPESRSEIPTLTDSEPRGLGLENLYFHIVPGVLPTSKLNERWSARELQKSYGFAVRGQRATEH